MEVACYRIKLNPGADPLVRDWSKRLNDEMPELKKLLRNEGMDVESVFLEKATDGDYLIYYVRSGDLKKTWAVAQASQHPIDIFHRKIMGQVCGDSVKLECLLDASSR